MRRGLAITLVALLSASAQATRAQTTAPVVRSAQAAAEDAAIDTWISEAAGEHEPLSFDADAPPASERRIHGEVGAAMGSGGYRSAYGIVNVPFGQASSVTLAAEDSRWRSRRRGSQEQRSVAIALFLDGSDIGRLLHRDRRCDMRQWAIKLKQDPVLNEDGTCERAP